MSTSAGTVLSHFYGKNNVSHFQLNILAMLTSFKSEGRITIQ